MIENVMSGIGGVGVFGVISLSIFFLFFTGLLIWSLNLKKNYLNSMCELPLEEESPRANQTLNPEDNHEK